VPFTIVRFEVEVSRLLSLRAPSLSERLNVPAKVREVPDGAATETRGRVMHNDEQSQSQTPHGDVDQRAGVEISRPPGGTIAGMLMFFIGLGLLVFGSLTAGAGFVKDGLVQDAGIIAGAGLFVCGLALRKPANR